MKITKMLLRKQNFERDNRIGFDSNAKINQELFVTATRGKKSNNYIDKFKVYIKILGKIEEENKKRDLFTLELEYFISFEEEEKTAKNNQVLAEEIVREFYNEKFIDKVKNIYIESDLGCINPPKF